MESSMGYYISRNEISITKLLNFSFLWTVLIAIVLIFFTALKTDNGYVLPDKLAIIFICGNILSSYCAGISYAKKNFFLPNIINLTINIVLIILLLLMDLIQIKIINNDTYLVIFFNSFLLQGIVSLIALGITYINSWELTFPSIVELIKLFKYGLIAFSSNVIFFLLYRVDYWFVKEYCNASDLGNYIQVSKIAQAFFILPGILAGAVFPLIAAGQSQNINNILATISRLIFVLYFFCCLVLAITGYWLFPMLFGNTYSHMYIPFLLLIPGILALSTLYTLTAYYAGKNKISVNIKGALIAMVFIVLTDIYLIPAYGINAAAIISSIGYMIYHIYVLATFTRENDTAAISFFNFKASDIQRIKKSILNKVHTPDE